MRAENPRALGGPAVPVAAVGALPLLGVLLTTGLGRRRELWFPGAAGLAAPYFPQRVVRLVGWPLLQHWRTLVVALAALAFARPARRDRSPQGADSPR
ncbi:MAG: hypothetical protein KA072_02860 [Thermoanaerobaculaceae bacterium]|nr:hypothetical protein [Thermoanaerobaculaceae bacterium]MDI9620543.1 hypothetical protein [Acidobacteriota bacterium]NLH11936.1 hypothetical protein [Holophagae bacterium]HPW55218.1 hypothetical protein [Thermoanaerobaculaceae bacterium]